MAQEEIKNLYDILRSVLHNDNKLRIEAEAKLRLYFAIPQKFLIYLINIMQFSQEDYIRKLSCVLFKQYVSHEEVLKKWNTISLSEQEEIKREILEALKKETDSKVSKQMCQAIAELAGIIFRSNKEWSELEELIISYIKDTDPNAEIGFKILSGLFSVDPNRYTKNLELLCNTFDIGFQRTSTNCLLAASTSLCTLLARMEVIGVKALYKYASCVIRTIELLFKEDNEDGLHDYLDKISEVIDKIPNFFRKDFSLLSEVLMRVSVKKDCTNEKLRQIPLEMLITLIQRIPKVINGDILQNLCLSIFNLAVSIDNEVDIEWLKPKEGFYKAEELNFDDNATFGAYSFDRLLKCIDSKTIFPIIGRIVMIAMENEDWRYRNAGLIIVAQIGEYCNNVEVIKDIMPTLIKHISHPHPKVRFAALYAVGLISDYLFPHFQEAYGKELIPLMIAAMDDKVPRVQSHACAALTNFLEHVSKDVAMEVASVLLPKLIKVVQEGISMAKENAMSCIGSIIESAYEKLVLHYDTLIPFLFTCIQQFAGKEYYQFRGQTIECLSMLVTRGNKEIFNNYGETLINLMITLQNEENTKGNPQRHYLLSSWERICLILGQHFYKYLPKVIEGIFKIARTAPELPNGSFESVLKEITEVHNKSEVNTSEIEEKEQALRMLKMFAIDLKGHYAIYVNETAKIVKPILTFNANSNLRKLAASLLADLLKCIKAAGMSYVEIGSEYVSNLILVLNKEKDTETKCTQVLALKELYEGIGHFMSPNDTKILINQIINYLNESNKQREALYHYNNYQKEETGGDINKDIKDQILNEEEYQKDLTYLLAEIAKTHTEEFVNEIPTIIHNVVQPYLEGSHINQLIALFIIDDLIEYLGVEKIGVELYNQLAAILIKYAVRPENDLRQAACYGIGSLSKASIDVFKVIAIQCLTALAAAAEIKVNVDDKIGLCSARDNAISSIGKILKHQESSIPFADIWSKWLCYLPICVDKEEAMFAHGFVADTLISKPEIAVGPNGSLLGEILRVFIEVYRRNMISEEGKVKMLQALKKLSEYPAIATLMNNICENQLTPERKQILVKMLQS